ncbi:MAG TPA: hypothetical protein VGS12_01995 [Caulobacteraceae bacterium]|nr:hypothetical protein [Caulobacteraceae bacterium]
MSRKTPKTISAAEAAAERTAPALRDRIGHLLHALTPQDCANYFRHAGYAPQ